MRNRNLLAASWFTARIATISCRVLAALIVAIIVLAAAVYVQALLTDPTAKPIALDFDAFWAAARMAVQGHATSVYDNGAIERVERAATAMPPGYLAFYYPPTFLLVCLPLGLLGFVAALVVFIAAQFALLVFCLRRILPQDWSWLPILIWPGFVMNALSGQNGGLSAVCLAGFMLLLERHALLAGGCLGLLTCKPQLVACVPVALIAARRWKAWAGFVATGVALALASVFAFGIEPWRGFLANAPNARIDLETLPFKWEKMQSSFAAVRLLGGSIHGAYIVQGTVSLIAVTTLAVVAARRPGAGAEAAALALCSLLATPFLYDYDLAALAIPLAWIAASAQATGWRPCEKIVASALFLLPLLLRASGMGLGLTLGPPCLLALLVVIARRSAGFAAAQSAMGVPA